MNTQVKCHGTNIVAIHFETNVRSHDQDSKLLGFCMSGTPKNGEGNPILQPGFLTGNPVIVRPTDNLKLGFSNRKSRNCRGNPNAEEGFPNGNQNFKSFLALSIRWNG